MPHFGEPQPCFYRWLQVPVVALSMGSTTFVAAGRVHMAQITVPKNLTLDRLGYQVGAVQAGNVRLGLYREGATPDIPDGGALVAESASVGQSPTVEVQLAAIPVTLLVRGRYWIGIQGDDVTGTFYHQRDDASIIGRRYDHAYGPFTDPCPATVINGRFPHMVARVVV